MTYLARLFALSCALLCATAQAAEPAPALKFVRRVQRHFEVGGAKLTLLGVNRYELAGGPQTGQCRKWGTQPQWWAWAKARIDDAQAMGANVIRLWAFQNFAGPSGTDFNALDKVVAYAKAKRIRLILVLENNWADCTEGGIKDTTWFAGGFAKPYGRYRLSFNDYLDAIVTRYHNEPAVAMWQILNEGKLFANPAVLQTFLAQAARRIRAIDKNHLISGGAAIQCWQGRQGAVDFQAFMSDPAIDVGDAHDYDEDQVAWPACMADALAAGRALNKPVMIGESGIKHGSVSAPTRALLQGEKIKAALDRGVAGYLLWSIGEKDGAGDGFDVDPKGSCGQLLKRARR